MTEEVMTTKEAIKYVAEHFGVPSRYALAQALSDEELKVQPIQISNYLNGTRMSKKVAVRFQEVYGVVISDVYAPDNLNDYFDKKEDLND